MSPVFRHGGLRLYLLKLLDEAPRHGYDVIRLLQDRFLGVYSPSPGTIYPRLARLEEEGLVTHDLVDGKKVYKITDAGRAELNRRLDDLADLEDELSASVRDIAREISRDVRETVRSLRDEFTWAVREAGKTGRTSQTGTPPGGTPEAGVPTGGTPEAGASTADTPEAGTAEAGVPAAGTPQAGTPRAGTPRAGTPEAGTPEAGTRHADADATTRATEAGPEAAGATGADHAGAGGAWSHATEPADETSTQGGTASEGTAGSGTASGGAASGGAASGGAADGGEREGASEQQRRTSSGGWREWADWADRREWRDWAVWAEQHDWREWAGRQDWKERARASHQEWKERAKAGRAEWAAGGRDQRQPDADLIVDLERLAAAFARELRGVAWQAGVLSEDAVGNLGRILTDALNRIRNEVFRAPESSEDES